MQQKTLLHLVPPSLASDYLEHFQCLAAVNVEIQQYGATAERLLRKSILEIDVGNFSAGLDAARDASDVRPAWAEAHYQEGMALLLLAFAKAGIIAGSAAMERPVGSVKTLLEHSAKALGKALTLNPADEEVKEDVAALAQFIAGNDGDLEGALHALGVDDLAESRPRP